jgi:GNAT superfamily N-acetyltransferase
MRLAKFDAERQLAQQRELFEDAFPEHVGKPPASTEHYTWKFHSFPSTPHGYEYVALDEDRLLGYYAAIPYPYVIAGRHIRVGMVCDVMTHSEARGRGVFTELGRYALAQLEATNLEFVTGYPVRPEVMGGHLRVGWKVAFELPMYLMPLRTNAVLATKGLAWLAPATNLGVRIYGSLLSLRPADGYTVSSGSPDVLLGSQSVTTFLKRWSASVPNHLVKSAEFYEWRLGAPGASYRAFLVHRGDVVVAVAIGRATELNGVPCLGLLDLMVLDDDRRALGTLLHALRDEARRSEAEAIVVMMSKRQAREYRLLRFGFLRSPFTFKLILRAVAETARIEDLSDESQWRLMWIDSDDL